jgi:hypothetical protein
MRPLTVIQVWSFSPPDENTDRRSESPLSMPDQAPPAEDEEEPTQFPHDIDVDANMSDV